MPGLDVKQNQMIWPSMYGSGWESLDRKRVEFHLWTIGLFDICARVRSLEKYCAVPRKHKSTFIQLRLYVCSTCIAIHTTVVNIFCQVLGEVLYGAIAG